MNRSRVSRRTFPREATWRRRMGIPPTGKQIALRGITILRFGDDHRVVERWSCADLLRLLVQLGAVPAPA
jgi:predicted ester cyclase